jgi:FixJ family two-component response regulator
LPDLLGELGFAAQTFASAEAFLGSDAVEKTVCLVLDIAMPGMSGPELQRELILRGWSIPIIFITAQARESVHSGLLGQGPVQCLFKPFSEHDLRMALNVVLVQKHR